MKSIISIIIVLVVLVTSAAGQKKRPAPRAKGSTAGKSSSQPAPSGARLVGTPVVLMTKNGDRIAGELLDLSAYSIRIRSSNLESTIALDTLASVSFGSSPVPGARQEQPGAAVHADFGRDAESAIAAFTSMANELKGGVDFTEYGRLIAEVRRPAERFIEKYSATENLVEARTVALIAGALTDYTWARNIWTLKLGRTSDGTVSEADSPAITDVIGLYPDLRAQSASGSKFSADKIVGGLWKKAEEKMSRARTSISQAR